MKPFENEASPAREIGLKLVGIEKLVLESPYYRKLLQGDVLGCKYVMLWLSSYTNLNLLLHFET